VELLFNVIIGVATVQHLIQIVPDELPKQRQASLHIPSLSGVQKHTALKALLIECTRVLRKCTSNLLVDRLSRIGILSRIVRSRRDLVRAVSQVLLNNSQRLLGLCPESIILNLVDNTRSLGIIKGRPTSRLRHECLVHSIESLETIDNLRIKQTRDLHLPSHLRINPSLPSKTSPLLRSNGC